MFIPAARSKQSGQSLIEVIVVLSVATIVITTLLITIVNSLRNAQFATLQTRSTKYAQDSLEKVREIRDRNGLTTFSYSGGTTTTFSQLWNIPMSTNCSNAKCRFKIDSTNLRLVQITQDSEREALGDGLLREVIFEDTATGSLYLKEKKITVKVVWSDTSGTHESNLQTILTKI